MASRARDARRALDGGARASRRARLSPAGRWLDPQPASSTHSAAFPSSPDAFVRLRKHLLTGRKRTRPSVDVSAFDSKTASQTPSPCSVIPSALPPAKAVDCKLSHYPSCAYPCHSHASRTPGCGAGPSDEIVIADAPSSLLSFRVNLSPSFSLFRAQLCTTSSFKRKTPENLHISHVVRRRCQHPRRRRRSGQDRGCLARSGCRDLPGSCCRREQG